MKPNWAFGLSAPNPCLTLLLLVVLAVPGETLEEIEKQK